MNKLTKQIIKFLIVGVLAFLIDYAFLYIFTDICGIHYLISSILAFLISLCFNYIASIKYVFDAKKQTYKEVILFVVLSAIGLLLNEIIMYVGVDKFNVYYMLVKLISTAIVMVYNFITRKLFIEKRA